MSLLPSVCLFCLCMSMYMRQLDFGKTSVEVSLFTVSLLSRSSFISKIIALLAHSIAPSLPPLLPTYLVPLSGLQMALIAPGGLALVFVVSVQTKRWQCPPLSPSLPPSLPPSFPPSLPDILVGPPDVVDSIERPCSRLPRPGTNARAWRWQCLP